MKVSDAIVVSSQNSRRYEFVSNGDEAQINAEVNERIMNERDLIKALHINTDEYEIVKFRVGKSEGFRKDRSSEWKVEDGKVVHGEVHDSGGALVFPMFSVQVWLKRKTQEIRARLAIADIKRDLEKYAFKYKRVKYPKTKDPLMYEVEFPDLHIGRLAWSEESGENTDLKLQIQRTTEAIDSLLANIKGYPVEKIILPIGSDYFNTDTHLDTTTAGTHQPEDTRWQKTFRAGRILAIDMIDKCMQIAPVEVLVIPGNHDTQRSFYLGEAINAWYHNCPNVKVDNSAHIHKYILYGTSLLGFTHEKGKDAEDLSHIMTDEVPKLWARSKVREWHVGHLHHKRDMFFKTFEDKGVTVRVLRSLAVADAWTHNNNFMGALKASEGFLWHKHDGLVAQFSVMAKRNPD